MERQGSKAWCLLVPAGGGLTAESWDTLVSVRLEILSDFELREHGRLDAPILTRLPRGSIVKAVSMPFEAWQ